MTTQTPPRVLVVLNENPLGSHPGIHEALSSLNSAGTIGEWGVFPYLNVRRDRGDNTALRELAATASDLLPDVVIWAHTMDWPVPARFGEALARSSSAVDVYWEADSYHPVFKPLPSAMVSLARRCAIVFIPCGGWMRRDLRLRGCRDVRYAPSATSIVRFPLVYGSAGLCGSTVALIGNRVHSRLPGKTMPGAKWRAEIVDAFEHEFGPEFAVYGDGWTGPSARGPIAFDEQQTVYASSRVALGVNNSHYPFVFSNRLPIAMACGIPIAYGRNPGFDRVFPEWMQPQFFESTPKALEVVKALLSLADEDLVSISQSQREEVVSRFTHYVVLDYIVRCADAKRLAQGSPTNPWLGKAGFSKLGGV